LIRRRDASAGTLLAQGDIVIDVGAQRAERAGRPLDLTAKELALLVYFLRHPGQVLSRTRIYESVWGGQIDGPSKTLDVHVMELRRKLEAFGPRVVHTFRGRGYLFGDPPAADSEEA
jgi:DNA-binding response OmpR family regulator